ncbi:MAG: hypothetical protein AABZ77_08655 [Chloroflexota bacterium]
MSKTLLLLTLLISLLGPLSGTSPAAATPDEMKWQRVNLPAGGEAGNWVLAAGSDVKHLTMASDGSLYAYANPSGTSYTLFKSADAGFSWASTGEVKDAIVAITTAPDDASIIYYATASSVFKSADAGKTFNPLPPGPGGAGSGNITITSINVARLNGKSLVAIGTADNDTSQYGGVYTLDESKLIPDWQNTGLGSYDVSAVAFSPNYNSDRQMLAVTTNETDTFVTARIGSGGWNQTSGKATITGRAARASVIAFPSDYDTSGGEYTLFVGIDTGGNNGDVYKIKGRWAPESSTATDLNIGRDDNLNNIDVTGLAISGNSSAASLMAGAANSTSIYISTDGGVNWTRSRKEPTGQSRTCLLMAANFTSSGIAYAATTGVESAFSYTTDGGATWNQASLIDGRISSNGILDLAVSPVYSRDGTLFMLTFDAVSTKHSLWRSRSGGAKWERVFSSAMANVDTLSMVELSPGYGISSQTVFLAGSSNGNPAIWKSADNGQTFTYRSAPSSIDVWAAVNDNSFFFGSYNGTNGLVYNTENSGFFYSIGTAAGSQPLKSIALSPNYERDGTILIGNSNGWVYYSSDNGTSFKPLPRDAVLPPLTGSITVAFDADFATSNAVYAASNSANKGIYRFIINKSTKWDRVDSTLPSGGAIGQLAVSTDGGLYATNSQSVNATANKGGIERSLNPTYPTGPTFETVTQGLDDGVNLGGLWLQGNQLWSIDTANTRLMTFTDSLALPVTLTSPADKASATGTGNVILKWQTMSGVTDYKWQLDYDTDFSAVPTGFEGDTKASSARLPELDTDTTYYWRVRATKPALSPWSAEGSFTTGLGSTVLAPELYSPKAGADGVPLKPMFQWSAMAGAGSYEMMVATDVSFSNPAIVRTGNYALPATAWQSNLNLDYKTTYYWKVRARGAASYSAWSAVGAFITQSLPTDGTQVTVPASLPSPPATSPPPAQPSSPQQPSSPPSPQTPAPPPPAQSALPDWFPYLTGAMLMAIVILLATVLVLVVTLRRR